jgi:hypothetical protein
VAYVESIERGFACENGSEVSGFLIFTDCEIISFSGKVDRGNTYAECPLMCV